MIENGRTPDLMVVQKLHFHLPHQPFPVDAHSPGELHRGRRRVPQFGASGAAGADTGFFAGRRLEEPSVSGSDHRLFAPGRDGFPVRVGSVRDDPVAR